MLKQRNLRTYLSALLALTVGCSSSLFMQNSALGAKAKAPQEDGAEGPSESAKRKVLSEAAKRPIKDKWAVVIGVNRFSDKTIPTLRYAAKDAKDFATFLVKSGNFAKDHVLLLLNEDATKHNILSCLADTWLPKRVLDDDLVVIYASTHGSPKEIDVGGDNFLIAHDTKRDELFTTGIKLQDLAPTIKQRTHCDRVVLILDACNSGAAKAGGKGLFRTTNFDVGALAGKGQIVISSSDANQRSWESKRYKNGVFTRSLIEVLEKSKETDTADLDHAFDKLKDEVQSEVRFDRQAFQTPVMRSQWQGDPLRLTAKPVSPRSVNADTKHPFIYEKIINKPDTPPQKKVTQIKATTRPATQTVSSPETRPTTQLPSTQNTSSSPQIIIRSEPQPKPKKPIVVPAGKEADLWFKFKNRN